ncbi:MAG: nucleotidyltransferase family protein [Verrucomicrobiota bacterium]
MLLALADPRGPAEVIKLAPPEPAKLRRLLELADRHGVLAIVMENLKRLTSRENEQRHSFLPDPAVCDWARQRMRQRTGLSLVLRRQALEIIARMQEAGLPAVILKGGDFADRLYSHPSLRPFTDVDLLIPQRILPETRQVFRELGYQPVVVPMKHQTGYGEESWRHPNRSGGMVEIHWNLVNSPSLRRALSVTYEDLQLETHQNRLRPSAAATLLIAAVHGVASHGVDRLQVLGDVVQAVRGTAGTLDETWLAQAVPRTGTNRALATALALAYKMYDEPNCVNLMKRLGIERRAWPGNLLLTRGVVLRAHASRDSFRRQLLREFLKHK